MELRPAHAPGLYAIAALHAANWRDAYRGVLADEYLDGNIFDERKQLWEGRFLNSNLQQFIIVAEEKDEILGFACTFGAVDSEHGTLLENLHVAKKARGSGLGIALIKAVTSWSIKNYPDSGLHLWALAQNHPARRYYEKLGGLVTGNGHWSPPVGPPVEEVRYSWPKPAQLLQPSA